MACDQLLEIETIKGESTDSKHPSTIEVESFSWGASNDGSAPTGSGAGAGKVSFQDIHLTAQVSKASPELLLACASGRHIKKAQLFVRKQGEVQQDYYVVTFEDLIVSAYSSGGPNGSADRPTCQFALNYGKIKFEYKPQKDDGQLDAAITATWDLKANKKGG